MHFARLALLGLSTLAACYLGFLHFDLAGSVGFIKHAGYWLVFAALALFLWSLWREARRIWCEGWRPERRHLGPLLFIFGASLLLYLLQPAGYMMVMDEPVLAATALHMHEEKEVLMPSRAYSVMEQFLLLEGSIDKRRFFYPLLVSLLHDFTGYRALQGVILNHLLAPVFLGLLFWFGRRLWAPWGGYSAVLLFLTVPLLAMNVNSGGFDLLNIIMILVTALAAERYLRRPDANGLNLLILSGVLLAHTRYESALYVPAVGLLVFLGWWKLRLPLLTWTAVVAPLLMVTIPLQQALLDVNPVLWQLEDEHTAVFSVSRVPENLASAAAHFFHFGNLQPNSLLLSLLFVLSLPVCAVCVLRGRIASAVRTPGMKVACILGVVVLSSFFLLMSYHWGQLDDNSVSRIALPFILLQVTVVVWALSLLEAGKRVGIAVVLAASGFFLFATRPFCASTDYFAYAWERAFVDYIRERVIEFDEEKPLFIMDPSPVAMAERVGAIHENYAAQHKAELELHRKLGTFGDILFITRVVPDPEDPSRRRTVSPLDRDFEMEVLREEKLTKKYYVRLARMTGVRWRPWDRRRLNFEFGGGELTREEAKEFFAETLP